MQRWAGCVLCDSPAYGVAVLRWVAIELPQHSQNTTVHFAKLSLCDGYVVSRNAVRCATASVALILSPMCLFMTVQYHVVNVFDKRGHERAFTNGIIAAFWATCYGVLRACCTSASASVGLAVNRLVVQQELGGLVSTGWCTRSRGDTSLCR